MKIQIITALLSLWLISSCRSSDMDKKESRSAAVVLVSISGSEFEDEGSLPAQGSNNKTINAKTLTRQEQTIALDHNFTLKATLIPLPLNTKKTLASIKDPLAETEPGDVTPGVKYKVVVYDASEVYVTERDYTRGQETSTQPLNLNGDENYIFIAYSINNISELPSISFSDSNNKTLSSSSLSSVNGNNDLMYFRRDMQVTGNGPNYLHIVFKHQFSQITTQMDASATGFNISGINAGFSPHYSTSDILLSNAQNTRTGNPSIAPITFTGQNSPIVTGVPGIINGNTTLGSFVISSLTIGPATKTNLTPFSNLRIIPGVKYNLNITIIPNDIYLTYMGHPAVRINGTIWLRHNLGADTTQNPDQNPGTSGLGGNYYQFGRNNVVATPTTPAGAISGWNTSSAPASAWNSGTVSDPVKVNSTDPCPNGYRVPTSVEYQNLIDNTTPANIGAWGSDATNRPYSAAKVLNSKTNNGIKITFPASGYRAASDGTLFWRSGSGGYWVSDAIQSSQGQMLKYSITGPPAGDWNRIYDNSDSTHNTRSGYLIRCIEE